MSTTQHPSSKSLTVPGVGRAYLARLTPDTRPDNGTAAEYVCQHSFVWVYLLPRLIFLMGYVSVFVSWFCLKHPDLITVVAEVRFAGAPFGVFLDQR